MDDAQERIRIAAGRAAAHDSTISHTPKGEGDGDGEAGSGRPLCFCSIIRDKLLRGEGLFTPHHFATLLRSSFKKKTPASYRSSLCNRCKSPAFRASNPPFKRYPTCTYTALCYSAKPLQPTMTSRRPHWVFASFVRPPSSVLLTLKKALIYPDRGPTLFFLDCLQIRALRSHAGDRAFCIRGAFNYKLPSVPLCNLLIYYLSSSTQ
ncbi:hypothetical protein V8C37DRAFT_132992 [Trichoderma ceciliae]